MITRLRYGSHASLELELRDEALVAQFSAPRGEPLASLGQAVDRALAAPLEYPPLSQSVVAGDRVAIALASGVPQAATIVARTVHALLGGSIDPSDITVVTTAHEPHDPLAELPPDIAADIQRETHNPANRDALSYLAAASDGKPIYINRTLHDADQVIVIGCLRVADSLGYHGIGSSLFPAFSDTAHLKAFQAPKANEPARHTALEKQADEVSWLLGARFTVQVVPGAGLDVLDVLAGDMDAVFRQGGRLCEEAWSCAVPERASLVVAALGGDATEQTWDNVARALAAASRAAGADGDVALCTELSQPLGPGLQRLVGAENLHEAMREVTKYQPVDALPATELVHALERGKVYLMSQLDDELVEELGASPVAAEHLTRLVSRYDSCIVLADAQYVVPRPPDDILLEAPTRGKRHR